MNRRPTMTLGRQVLLALLLPLGLTLVLIVVAHVALARVADAKDAVIDREAVLVADSYRLDAAVAERGVSARNLLVTGDDVYRTHLSEADAEYDDAHRALELNLRRPEQRQQLEEVSARFAALVDVTEEIVSERREGRLPDDALEAALRDRLNPARAAIVAPLDELVADQEAHIARAVASSDATVRGTTRLLWSLGLVGVALGIGSGMLIARRVNHRLSGLALSIDAAAAEILAGTAQQVAGAAQQAAAVQQTVATADELAQTADESATRARGVADAAQRSASIADEGAVAVGESASSMTEIRAQMDAITGTVVALAERARDISGIVDAIEELADQSHLLALNAAIEASRAGEHGRGFSVVASEVRALAEQSKRATNQIAEILGEIQRGTQGAVLATEQGVARVLVGVERIERTGATIETLSETVASAAVVAEQISGSAGQQAIATVQISQAMRDLDDVAQQNAAAARQAEQAARDLTGVATDLKALVGTRDGR